MQRILSISILLTLCSCGSPEPTTSNPWHYISGRNTSPQPIYRSIVPNHWVKKPTESDLNDTMKPICEYLIADEIRLVVHNFPSDSLSQRIPPQAQVARWQRQTGPGTLTQECQNGFIGLRLESENLIAWAMQMDPELYLSITGPAATLEDGERRADYTIKVTGPQDLLEAHRLDIETFAHQFELIEPISLDT